MSIKLIWGSAKIVPGRWHAGLFCIRERPAPRRSRDPDRIIRSLVISLRGLLCWSCVLMLVAYFSAAAVIHRVMENRPHNLVTLEDCVLYPLRHAVIQSKQGHAFVNEGLDDIKAGHVRPGMQKLSLGLVRYPQGTTGRLVLARIYALLGSRPRAIKLLQDGLPYTATDQTYMAALLQFAAEGEDFGFWLEACDDALAQSASRPDLAGFRRWIITKKITGLTEAGKTKEAAQLAEDTGAETNATLAELKTLALLKGGEPSSAITFIVAWQKRNTPSPNLFPLLARALREAGRLTDMERALAAWCERDPSDPTPFLDRIINRSLLHDEAGAQDAEGTFFLHFNSYPDNLLRLAEALVPLGETSLSRRCLAQAESQGFPTYTLKQFLMETCISKGDWAQAKAVFDELGPSHPKDDPMAGYWLLAGNLINAALDPASGVQSGLVSEIQQQAPSIKAYHRLLDVLQTAGRNATALDVVRTGLDRYPGSVFLQRTSAALTTEVTAAEAAKPKPVMPRITLGSVAADKIEAATRATLAGVDDESLFFKNLNADIQQGKPADALVSIHTARTSHPDWLSSREDELSLTEIKLYGIQKDTLTMQGLARFYLNGDLRRSSKVLTLAKTFHEAGDPDTATLLMKQILKATPNFTLAGKTLAGWMPLPAKADPVK